MFRVILIPASSRWHSVLVWTWQVWGVSAHFSELKWMEIGKKRVKLRISSCGKHTHTHTCQESLADLFNDITSEQILRTTDTLTSVSDSHQHLQNIRAKVLHSVFLNHWGNIDVLRPSVSEWSEPETHNNYRTHSFIKH